MVHVVPLTSKLRGFASEIEINPDRANGLQKISSIQCQHIRAAARGRIENSRGNVGSSVLAQIREVLALILDVPG